MANHLAKFLPHLAHTTKPMRDLLCADTAWLWGPDQERSFAAVKEALAKAPLLTHYNPKKRLIISADASSYGICAVLLQETDGKRMLIAYASRSLTETELRYAEIEKEVLAVTYGPVITSAWTP